MKRNRTHSRRSVRSLALPLMAASVLHLSVAPAAEEDPPPVLSSTVQADGSTPPVGRLPAPPGSDSDYERYPTAYRVPIDAGWELFHGNPLPEMGVSPFYGTVGNSPEPRLYTVSSLTFGERWVQGKPAGVYAVSPYFIADEEITCDNGTSAARS